MYYLLYGVFWNLCNYSFPFKKKWQPTPIFLPEKPHGQRSLAGYSPQGLRRVRHNLVTKQQQLFI